MNKNLQLFLQWRINRCKRMIAIYEPLRWTKTIRRIKKTQFNYEVLLNVPIVDYTKEELKWLHDIMLDVVISGDVEYTSDMTSNQLDILFANVKNLVGEEQ